MGTCANFKGCEVCNNSEYNQTLDIKLASTTTEKKVNISDEISEFVQKTEEERKSWWKFEKLLESDKSWEIKDWNNKL